jgi:hypothetical protein
MEEMKEYIDVENVIYELRPANSFINEEMRHSCIQFNDDQPFSYADEPFYVNLLGSMSNLVRDNDLSQKHN